ncbi:nucleoside 2-deoxyribosyltransferase [Paucisalibacillus sp. EB02]|uniref:nucleoside 2-deoxyribosyltransferase n=1 Tax=Paucisalibacillus sp. EB02 TaxID=1347087 RepID=UPI0004B1D28C|nr:nucleoside 2-deoxyribosyltransferase [Paucisalibacillus sp. EB02]
MKFYIASGLDNKEKVQLVRDKLIKAGHTITYDWTKNNRASTEEELREIGIQERNAVLDCDIILVLLPGGKGTHTELGMAIGFEKRIHLYSRERIDPTSATTFYYVDGIQRYDGELESFVQEMIELYS